MLFNAIIISVGQMKTFCKINKGQTQNDTVPPCELLCSAVFLKVYMLFIHHDSFFIFFSGPIFSKVILRGTNTENTCTLQHCRISPFCIGQVWKSVAKWTTAGPCFASWHNILGEAIHTVFGYSQLKNLCLSSAHICACYTNTHFLLSDPKY